MLPLSLWSQLFSLLGAMFCLVAYIGHQLNWMDAKKSLYNLLNIFGSGILLYTAFHPFQAGFVLMETIWMLVSFYALLQVVRAK